MIEECKPMPPPSPSIEDSIFEEMRSAYAKYGDYNTMHELYAVLKEELDEFWDEVKKQKHNRERMIAELIQISAVAKRGALQLYANR